MSIGAAAYISYNGGMDGSYQARSLRDFFRWNKTSYALFSGFLMLIGLILYVWWPLAVEYASYFDRAIPIWQQLDYLLIGIFLAMTILIMANANLKRDLPLVLVGFVGGLVIEAWGTQTELWFYYTFERPPLWIVPAWPIAALSIERLTNLFELVVKDKLNKVIPWLYWLVFVGFLTYMLWFVFPTITKSLTIAASLLCIVLVAVPVKKRKMLFIFLMGSLLGYFLELWGTTRGCWMYYTLETPPFFAVLAHGMASVAFWRAVKMLEWMWGKVFPAKKDNRVPVE